MLNGLDVDLLFTGELSHHEALAAIEQGKCVITVFHSNTERGFLKARMKSALETEVANQIHRFHGGKEDQAVLGGSFDIHISETDRDPYEIVMASELDGVSW
jgi:putative NIF3 family GTP cyclohydrolase 1 type 2